MASQTVVLGHRTVAMVWPRVVLLGVVAGAALAGYLATTPHAAVLAASHDGAALTRLMRFMAAVKMLLAAAALAAVVWRLGAPVSLAWYGAYAAAAAAMAAGPGLIWGMVHVGAGALALHGGLLASVLLLWRDPETPRMLAAAVARRRQGV